MQRSPTDRVADALVERLQSDSWYNEETPARARASVVKYEDPIHIHKPITHLDNNCRIFAMLICKNISMVFKILY